MNIIQDVTASFTILSFIKNSFGNGGRLASPYFRLVFGLVSLFFIECLCIVIVKIAYNPTSKSTGFNLHFVDNSHEKSVMNKDVQLSKSLSWLLRHGAIKEGLEISPEGYIEVNKILNHKSLRGKYNKNDIERVVNNNDKQRFKLRLNESNVLEIKANQGHSITTVSDAELIPILEPKYKTVIHGTYLKCWPEIKLNGLSRMKRQHIHLAKGTPNDTEIVSGLRNNSQIHIYIDLAKSLQDGIKFYESENGVILTRGNKKGYLEPKYFEKVVDIRSGEQLFP